MEHNFILTGDEARTLMMALAESSVASTTSATISLWLRLSAISQVQPSVTPKEND